MEEKAKGIHPIIHRHDLSSQMWEGPLKATVLECPNLKRYELSYQLSLLMLAN